MLRHNVRVGNVMESIVSRIELTGRTTELAYGCSGVVQTRPLIFLSSPRRQAPTRIAAAHCTLLVAAIADAAFDCRLIFFSAVIHAIICRRHDFLLHAAISSSLSPHVTR